MAIKNNHNQKEKEKKNHLDMNLRQENGVLSAGLALGGYDSILPEGSRWDQTSWFSACSRMGLAALYSSRSFSPLHVSLPESSSPSLSLGRPYPAVSTFSLAFLAQIQQHNCLKNSFFFSLQAPL